MFRPGKKITPPNCAAPPHHIPGDHRKNDQDFRQAVNTVLARHYRSGQIVQIYDRWFGKLGKPGELIVTMYLLNALPE